jgi:lipopolysaccharide assembly outer membrane protein LptD (OstA)
MKLLMLSVAMACQAFAFAPQGVCQQQNPQPERPYLTYTEAPRLYFSMPPTERIGRVELAASNAQLTLDPQANLTSAEIESVLQLRGNVQVRMCAPSSHGCEKWSILLRADAVDYNEQTREIDAHGNVHIEPYQSQNQQNTLTPH